MASTYLYRTPSAGNRKTWTWSCWVKRSDITNRQDFFSAGTASNNTDTMAIRFDSSGTLTLAMWSADIFQTSQLFRDTSAWYHMVLAMDTTQSTASDRVKLYVNGSQVTDFNVISYPSQNADLGINGNVSHNIGRLEFNDSFYFDGYFAHVHFTDGTAYAASDFGETDTNGQWKPKSTPSVTYGTNGFFLKFANSGSLGTDSSGNGNNWTVSGSGDQVTDTPDNVFATLNPLQRSSTSAVLSEGNCKLTNNTTTNPWQSSYSTIGMNTGKWYWEYKVDSQNGSIDPAYGIVADSNTQYQDNTFGNLLGQQDATASSYGISFYGGDGTVYWSHIGGFSNSSAFGGHSVGDIIGVAVDFDNDAIYFSVNGTYVNSGDPTSGASKTGAVTTGFANNQTWFAQGQCYTSSDSISANFGNPSFSITSGNTDDNGYGNFEYAPPTGYLALCTKNLASELTLPIGNGKDYFNTVLWTSNGSNATVTGVGFQPDFVWQKTRNAARHHHLYNSSRFTSGYGTWLQSSNADQEANLASTGLTSYSSDGFTHSFNSPQGFEINGETQVAWNWLNNGGTTSSNTDGTLTTTVQVNTTAGFSIVEWTGNGGGSTTVGHGLGVAPDMMIMHPLNVSTNWRVWHQDLSGGNYFLILDSTNGQNNNEPIFTGAPSSTVVNLGSDYNGNGTTYVMFAFTTKEGYSKFGGYTGNGSTDGPFVYTGFRPAFVMTKRTNAVGPWNMKDTKRPGYNDTDDSLFAESTATEDVRSFDILSNGFKLKNGGTEMNGGGSTYIYMAFAENPFVDSTGRPVTAR